MTPTEIAPAVEAVVQTTNGAGAPDLSDRTQSTVIGMEAVINLSRLSGGDRAGNRVVIAEINSSLMNVNSRSPFPSMHRPLDADVPAGVGSRDRFVPRILLRRGITQVAQSIIGWITANVVDQLRIFSGHHFPYDPRSKHFPAVDVNNKPAVLSAASCNLTRVARVPGLCPAIRCGARIPRQMSRRTIIGKQVVQLLRRGQLAGSHSENHLSFGQGLALLTQRLRPAFPSRITVRSQAGGAVCAP